SMPELVWETVELPRYENPRGDGVERARRKGIEALKLQLAIPPALETRIDPEAREIWAVSLKSLERYRILADEALRVATAPVPMGTVCDEVSSIGALPETWRVQAQIL